MTGRTSILTWKNSQAHVGHPLAAVPPKLVLRISIATVLTVVIGPWLYISWYSLSNLSHLDEFGDECSNYKVDQNQRFIIFHRPVGQGAGNIMSGLLAVHTLGLEFDRTVCVHPSYFTFHVAFEAIHHDTVQACRKLFDCERPLLGNVGKDGIIRLLNFHPPPNECLLQRTLASPNHRILWMEANAYPRWTSTPSNLRFTEYYKPKPALLEIFPWTKPPRQVVHLRAPDSTSDFRKGLDDPTLEALGKTLPGDTYLVTNKVAWYDWFAQRYGWSHPPWQGVTHSALALSWGDRNGRNIPRVVQDNDQNNLQHLQLWADWYTILRASSVIHTHSDFSSSAVHWMNIEDAHVLDGVDLEKDTLQLLPEAVRRHESAIPLSQRQEDPRLPRQQRLEHCDNALPLSGVRVG